MAGQKANWWDENRPTYDRIKATLYATFPATFTPSFPLPLHHAVKQELLSYSDPLNVTKEELDIFLKFWTSRTEYLECAVVTKGRYDINGKRVSPLQHNHLRHFQHRLTRRRPVLRESLQGA